MPGSILTDTDGEITAIFIVLASNSWHSEQTIVNDLVKALPSVEFWVKSSNYFSSNTQIGGLLNDNKERFQVFNLHLNTLNSFKDAGFQNQDAFYNWLIENLPYSPHFSDVKIFNRNGLERAVDLLTISENQLKYNETKKIHKEFPELKFSFNSEGLGYWEGNSGLVRVEIIEADNSSFNLTSEELACRESSINEFNSRVNAFALNWDERFCFSNDEIEKLRSLDWYSEQISIETIGEKLSAWPQDQFYVRYQDSSFGVSMAQLNDKDASLLQYCGLTFAGSRAFSWNSQENALKISGGNMHISGNLVFVGRDAITLYNTSDWISAEDEIRVQVFGTLENKGLVWIGVETKGTDLVNKGFQPVYHIDLFFQPIGFFPNEKGEPIFHYIFAQPVLEDLLPAFTGKAPESLNNLISRFQDTQISIEKQLTDLKIQSKPIFIAMPMKFLDAETAFDVDWSNPSSKPTIGQYWSFANGLINRKGDVIEFLWADYSGKDVPEIVSTSQNKAKKDIEKAIKHLTIVPIKGLELRDDKDAGLRCRVKVLSRSF